MDKDKINRVNLSLGRCLINDSFLDSFYHAFLRSDPRIARQFEKTDIQKQKSLLREGITFIVMAAGDSSFARREIKKLGILHSEENLNISPDLYPVWIDTLIETITKYDKQIDKSLVRDWREVLQSGIKPMKELFRQKVG